MIAALLGSLCATAGLQAEPAEAPRFTGNGAVNFTEHVGIDQNLGAELDLELPFLDESGRDVRLGEYFDERPVVLVLAYYECPQLCTMVLNGTLQSLRAIRAYDCGRDYEVVVISIDPGESPELARAKRDAYVAEYGRAGAEEGWHFLVGPEASIRSVADAAGFRYVYDPKTDEYAHASGIMVTTPDGHLSRYFYGVEYVTKDLQLGLVEASEGRIGTLTDKVLLLCYMYDPATGEYGLAIMTSLRILGGVTVVLMFGYIARMLLRERAAQVEVSRVG